MVPVAYKKVMTKLKIVLELEGNETAHYHLQVKFTGSYELLFRDFSPHIKFVTSLVFQTNLAPMKKKNVGGKKTTVLPDLESDLNLHHAQKLWVNSSNPCAIYVTDGQAFMHFLDLCAANGDRMREKFQGPYNMTLLFVF